MCQGIEKATERADDKPKFLVYRLSEDTKFKQCTVKDVLDAYGCSCEGLGKSKVANENAPDEADAGA